MSGCAIGDDSAVTSIAPAGISQQGICHDAKIHCCDPYRSSLLESRLQYNDADMRRQSQYKCVVKGLMESLQSDTGGDDRKPWKMDNRQRCVKENCRHKPQVLDPAFRKDDRTTFYDYIERTKETCWCIESCLSVFFATSRC